MKVGVLAVVCFALSAHAQTLQQAETYWKAHRYADANRETDGDSDSPPPSPAQSRDRRPLSLFGLAGIQGGLIPPIRVETQQRGARARARYAPVRLMPLLRARVGARMFRSGEGLKLYSPGFFISSSPI